MSELTQEIEKEEGMYVYDKKIECPVCMKEFTTKIVKTGKARFKGSEMDLRPIYEGVDTIKYDVYMCRTDVYAARFAFAGFLPGPRRPSERALFCRFF